MIETITRKGHKMQILINNKDLAYTIDTYGMFENTNDEYILEGLQEQYPGITYDDIEWEYNHSEYVKNLAHASINILHNEFVTHGDGIVKSIDYVKSGSPKFYNYTTDWYTATWDIDETALHAWISKNKDKFNQFIRETSWDVEEGTEDYIVAELDFYTSTLFDAESYESLMYEAQSEAGDVIEYEVSGAFNEQ